MPDAITLTGLVATPPRHLVTSEGLPITSFRLASSQRRFDRSQEKWVDGDTNWYTVTAFRQLALNSNASLEKGHRVIVSGRLKIREWQNGEKSGTTIEIDADSIGHDLTWGTAAFTRSVSAASVAPADPADEAAAAELVPDGDLGETPESSVDISTEAVVADEQVPVPF